MIRILILFFSGIAFGQKLQHQMISASGQFVTTLKGIKVSQTVAQQSVIGTSIKKGVIFSQGFQQNNIQFIDSSFKNTNKTIVFPNPITDHINFKMTNAVKGYIRFSLYDVQGKLVVFQKKEANDLVLNIINLSLPSGQYFATLEGNNYSFNAIILKSN